MAFNGNFAVTENVDISKFTLTDTSTGVDTNLTDRKIYLYKVDATTLVPSGTPTDYLVWPIADATIDIDALDKDYALSIVVIWNSSSPLPDPSTYTKTLLHTFTGYSYAFWYMLIQQMAANPLISSDKNFYANLSKFVTDLDNAIQATVSTDQYSAQKALDRDQYMIDNKNIYF